MGDHADIYENVCSPSVQQWPPFQCGSSVAQLMLGLCWHKLLGPSLHMFGIAIVRPEAGGVGIHRKFRFFMRIELG